MTKRYMTPIKYKDGFGKELTAKLYFELDPIELADWVFANAFEANELRASLIELRDIEQEDSRNLTQDELGTLLGVIKLLAELSAGKPTDDGQYFLKDPNWTSSYQYRAFREFLFTNPKEVQEFLATLLDNDTMEVFTKSMADAADKVEDESKNAETRTADSGPETVEAMKAKIAEYQAKIESGNASAE